MNTDTARATATRALRRALSIGGALFVILRLFGPALAHRRVLRPNLPRWLRGSDQTSPKVLKPEVELAVRSDVIHVAEPVKTGSDAGTALASRHTHSSRRYRRSWNLWIALITVATACAAVFGISAANHDSSATLGSSTSNGTLPGGSVKPGAATYSAGVADKSAPSGMLPPSPTALAGYTQTYVQNFNGTTLPPGWDLFTGKPGGDPGAQWAASHVVVDDGMLQLNTWRDAVYGDEWVSGGVCQCGQPATYGAFFVRSRVTGVGPNTVELLWPLARVWPPEVDFYETSSADGGSATLHFNPKDYVDQRTIFADMTAWHTWGVIWTPTSVTYTLDGTIWGTVSVVQEIPQQPMTLDIDQETWCSKGWGCPTQPESMLIDWVAEYSRSS